MITALNTSLEKLPQMSHAHMRHASQSEWLHSLIKLHYGPTCSRSRLINKSRYVISARFQRYCAFIRKSEGWLVTIPTFRISIRDICVHTKLSPSSQRLPTNTIFL